MTSRAPSPASSFFSDFAAFQRHLDARGLFRINPGLGRIAAVLERLDLTRPPFVTVQVAGTNGKGSTSTMLAELAQAHGLKTGLYTSPHLVSVRERIRMNGSMASEETLLRGLEAIMAVGGADLTYFELLTALAVRVFADEGVDLAVLETGLGGTWDAVTAVAADLTLFTPIDLDHAQVLGPTLAHIARDKAGAIRPGVPVLSAVQRPEAWRELVAAAEEKGSPLRTTADEPWPAGFEPETLGLSGPHQTDNARLALAAWHLLGAREDVCRGLSGGFPDVEAEGRALRAARIPGRLQRTVPRSPAELEQSNFSKLLCSGDRASGHPLAGSFGSPSAIWSHGQFQNEIPPEGVFVPCALGRPALVLDGAHNPHGMAALGRALAKTGTAPAATVFACMADKDVEHLIAHVRVAAVGGPIIVPRLADNERAMPAEELAERIGLNAEAAPSVREALRRAAEIAAERLPESFSEPETRHPVLVCGSLYLLGEVFTLWPDLLEPADA